MIRCLDSIIPLSFVFGGVHKAPASHVLTRNCVCAVPSCHLGRHTSKGAPPQAQRHQAAGPRPPAQLMPTASAGRSESVSRSLERSRRRHREPLSCSWWTWRQARAPPEACSPHPATSHRSHLDMCRTVGARTFLQVSQHTFFSCYFGGSPDPGGGQHGCPFRRTCSYDSPEATRFTCPIQLAASPQRPPHNAYLSSPDHESMSDLRILSGCLREAVPSHERQDALGVWTSLPYI